MKNSEQLLAEVLRYALAEQQARLAEIEASVAWRVGGLVTAVLRSPLRLGPRNAFRAFRLFLGARRGRQSPAIGVSGRPCPSPLSMRADYLIYGESSAATAWPGTVWQTDDAGELTSCLEERESPGTLVLRRADISVVRPLGRLQEDGWQLVWFSQEKKDSPGHLVRYVSGIADKIVDGKEP